MLYSCETLKSNTGVVNVFSYEAVDEYSDPLGMNVVVRELHNEELDCLIFTE